VGARAFSPPLCLRLARSGIATLRTFAERLRTGRQAAPIRATGSFSRITTPRTGQVGISARATHHATDRRLCPLLSGRLAAGQERGLVVPHRSGVKGKVSRSAARSPLLARFPARREVTKLLRKRRRGFILKAMAVHRHLVPRTQSSTSFGRERSVTSLAIF
jgi:hypothetical protein